MAARACGRIKLVIFLMLLHSLSLFPQDRKDKKEQTSTFRLPVGVVVVNATVTDKDGKAVLDLSKDDFKVYEDGKRQAVQTLALESHKPFEDVRGGREEQPPEAEPGSRPARPRLISVMIDDLASEPEDRYVRVAGALSKFIETEMGPGDQVGIWSGSGRVQYPFSDDKQILRERVATLVQKLYRNPVERSECPVITDLQAQKIANQQEDDDSLEIATAEAMKCLNLDPQEEASPVLAENYARMAASRQYHETNYNVRTLLFTFRQHLRSLRHFDATKSAIFFSDGFLHREVIFELQDVVEQALQSGVVLNVVDARGLSNPYYRPASEPTAALPASLGRKQLAYTDDALAQEDSLNQLASDTGGIYFHNNNDMFQGIQQISSRQDHYYILTYAIPPQKPDGRFHSIKVEVNRPGLKVSFRKGYYAPKEEVTFERQKKEDILEALQAPGNLNEIPMGLSFNCYQDDETTYVVSFMMKIGIRGLRFLDEDSRHKNLINMVVVAFDETDRYVAGIEKSVDFRLTDSSYAGLLNRGITSRVEFKLPLGRYRIKAVVREASQGKMGSLTKAIEIP
jgi:VWFA-related protein